MEFKIPVKQILPLNNVKTIVKHHCKVDSRQFTKELCDELEKWWDSNGILTFSGLDIVDDNNKLKNPFAFKDYLPDDEIIGTEKHKMGSDYEKDLVKKKIVVKDESKVRDKKYTQKSARELEKEELDKQKKADAIVNETEFPE